MNAIVGIISYLPDDEKVRSVRLERCKNLCQQVATKLNLSFIMIAQNWKMSDFEQLKTEAIVSVHPTIYGFDKLGITRARETLRQKFLETTYDTLIHFDDDFCFSDEIGVGRKFLRVIDKYPNHIVENRNFLFNGLVIPRDIYEKEPFDLSVSAENSSGYEDWIYASIIKNVYKDRYIKIDLNLSATDRHTMTLDKFTTWKHLEERDRTDISRQKIIEGILRRVKK